MPEHFPAAVPGKIFFLSIVPIVFISTLSILWTERVRIMDVTRKKIALIAAAAALAGLTAGGVAGYWLGRNDPAVQETPPDAVTLKRAANRALRDIGVRARSAGVESGVLRTDGSRPVTVRLENGRTAQGRLYRDRLRWKISLDRRSLRDVDRVIVVEHEGISVRR